MFAVQPLGYFSLITVFQADLSPTSALYIQIDKTSGINEKFITCSLSPFLQALYTQLCFRAVVWFFSSISCKLTLIKTSQEGLTPGGVLGILLTLNTHLGMPVVLVLNFQQGHVELIEQNTICSGSSLTSFILKNLIHHLDSPVWFENILFTPKGLMNTQYNGVSTETQ